MIGSGLTRYRDGGLLLLRIGIGLMFMAHGIPKLLGGPEKWKIYGAAMGNLGVHFAPVFWGLLAGLAETFGGLLFLLGFAFRPACVLLIFMMFTALMSHMTRGDKFGTWSHAAEDGILFIAMLLIGPGKYSLDKK